MENKKKTLELLQLMPEKENLLRGEKKLLKLKRKHESVHQQLAHLYKKEGKKCFLGEDMNSTRLEGSQGLILEIVIYLQSSQTKCPLTQW